MLKVRFWFNWNLSPRCSAIQSFSELWVCAWCCSLFIASIGRTLFHTFRTLPGPFFFLFFVSPSLSAILYFISSLAGARQSEDTGDEAVTCCLHLAVHHQQLRLQIYFPVDCGHRRSRYHSVVSVLTCARFTFPSCAACGVTEGRNWELRCWCCSEASSLAGQHVHHLTILIIIITLHFIIGLKHASGDYILALTRLAWEITPDLHWYLNSRWTWTAENCLFVTWRSAHHMRDHSELHNKTVKTAPAYW